MKRVFINGKFHTGSGNFAEAVLVENGIFTSVGSSAEVKSLAETIGKDCEVIDLEGRTVLPGFNDSHSHLYTAGVLLTSLAFGDCSSIAEFVEAGKRFIEKNKIPEGRLVTGYRWNQDLFKVDGCRLPDRHDLDKISTVHPIIAYRACTHMISCNSLALEMAGITKDTPDVPGGEIRRDENGELNGILTEHAMVLIDTLKAGFDIEEMAKAIQAGMEYASSYGITSIQTNCVRNENADAMLQAYNLVYERGLAKLRTYHQCCFTDIDGLKGFIAKGRRMGEKLSGADDMHKVGPIKMFVDGSLGAHTAAMRAPYADAPETMGVYCCTVEELDEIVQTAHKAGFGCVIHAIGDGAMDMVLTSYEKVIQNGDNKLRHGIIHVQITDIPLLERFKKSDVLALVQPVFLHCDIGIVEKRAGKELASTSYAFGTMNKLGVHVSYGTDAPIEDLNPFENLHCAVKRQDLSGAPKGGFYPNECVPLEEAIDNYTVESAYASFDEDKKGRIAPGFLADMCVLENDIFSTDDIMSNKVLMTVLGGEIVYKA